MIFAIYLPKIPKKSVFFVDFHIDLSFEENWNGPEVGIDKETHGRELGQLLRRERPILSSPRVKLLPGTRYTVSRQKREDRGDQHGSTITFFFGLNRPKFSQLRLSKSGKLVWVPISSRVLRTHFEKSRLDFLALQENYLESRRNFICNLKKKVPHTKRPQVSNLWFSPCNDMTLYGHQKYSRCMYLMSVSYTHLTLPTKA